MHRIHRLGRSTYRGVRSGAPDAPYVACLGFDMKQTSLGHTQNHETAPWLHAIVEPGSPSVAGGEILRIADLE